MKEIEEGVPITLKVAKHQADATLSQANPVSGTKYEVLATTKNVRIISITGYVEWTVQPTPLEAHITIDGQALRATKIDPVTATTYYTEISAGGTLTFVFTTTDHAHSRAFLFEGRNVKIEVEVTGGTVSLLEARVKYGKLD